MKPKAMINPVNVTFRVQLQRTWTARILIRKELFMNQCSPCLSAPAQCSSVTSLQVCIFKGARLQRWTPDDCASNFPDEWDGQTYEVSRSWVIYHVLEHDLHHGGEVR